MLQEYSRNTNIGVGIGLILQIVGRIIVESGDGGAATLGNIVTLIGLVPFIWGCSQYAKGKGHSPWYGALGLLSILGLILLVFLPDQHKDAAAQQTD